MEKFEIWLIVCEIVTILAILIDYIRFTIITKKMESKNHEKGNEKQCKQKDRRG